MDGTRTWCHFVQRFERGRLQQQVKALPGELPPSCAAFHVHRLLHFCLVCFTQTSTDMLLST